MCYNAIITNCSLLGLILITITNTEFEEGEWKVRMELWLNSKMLESNTEQNIFKLSILE